MPNRQFFDTKKMSESNPISYKKNFSRRLNMCGTFLATPCDILWNCTIFLNSLKAKPFLKYEVLLFKNRLKYKDVVIKLGKKRHVTLLVILSLPHVTFGDTTLNSPRECDVLWSYERSKTLSNSVFRKTEFFYRIVSWKHFFLIFLVFSDGLMREGIVVAVFSPQVST